MAAENTTYIDYSYVETPARIALYDDLLSSPRIIEVSPNKTKEFIGDLSSVVYEQARLLGGKIPYTIIAQVAENFIHASFSEMVVSIFDNGNTIRFTDQGPGIPDKEKAQKPGYSSANKEMKRYINGVGSGLPIVREYLDTKQGSIFIEDNLNSGAVVTITLESDQGSKVNEIEAPQNNSQNAASIQISSPQSSNTENLNGTFIPLPPLTQREKDILTLFKRDDIWGVKDIATATNIPMGSTHNELAKMEEMGIVVHIGTKRTLTDYGKSILASL